MKTPTLGTAEFISRIQLLHNRQSWRITWWELNLGTLKVPHICTEHMKYTFGSLTCMLSLLSYTAQHVPLTRSNSLMVHQNNGEVRDHGWDTIPDDENTNKSTRRDGANVFFNPAHCILLFFFYWSGEGQQLMDCLNVTAQMSFLKCWETVLKVQVRNCS